MALIVGASGLMLTAVFGFLSFVPGIDPEADDFFQLAFFMGALITIAGFVAYVVMSRKADSGEPLPKFDRLLEQRKAALGAIPVGLLAVAIGALWFMIRTLTETRGIGLKGAERFNDFQTPGIIAFLGFGTLYVALATWLVIRAERGAIRAIRDRAEVTS